MRGHNIKRTHFFEDFVLVLILTLFFLFFAVTFLGELPKINCSIVSMSIKINNNSNINTKTY